MKKENLAPARARQPVPVLTGSSKSLNLSLAAQGSGVLVLHCEGRLIFQGEARRFAAIIAEVLPSAGRMIVDLSGVESIDSAGLGELVMTHMWADAAGFELKFAGARKPVRQLLELTNLVSIFDLYPSVPEAMNAMRQEEVPSA